MPTPVAMPLIVVLLQFYPGAGTAVPTPKQGNPSVMSTFLTMEDCERDRQFRGHAEEFFCLEYKSEKYIDHVFPADKQRQSLNGVAVGPLALKEADKPFIEPLVEPKPEPPKATVAPAPKKLAERPRYERQAMFEGNPLTGLFNW